MQQNNNQNKTDSENWLTLKAQVTWLNRYDEYYRQRFDSIKVDELGQVRLSGRFDKSKSSKTFIVTKAKQNWIVLKASQSNHHANEELNLTIHLTKSNILFSTNTKDTDIKMWLHYNHFYINWKEQMSPAVL